MKNFIARGDTITVAPTYALMSGQGYLAAETFGVAAADIAEGSEGPLNLTGVYDLPKAPSQAWTVGQKVYWEQVAGRATTTASGNALIGAAVLAVGGGAGETIGRVRLNGAAV